MRRDALVQHWMNTSDSGWGCWCAAPVYAHADIYFSLSCGYAKTGFQFKSVWSMCSITLFLSYSAYSDYIPHRLLIKQAIYITVLQDTCQKHRFKWAAGFRVSCSILCRRRVLSGHISSARNIRLNWVEFVWFWWTLLSDHTKVDQLRVIPST